MTNAWRGVPSPLPGPASGQSAKSDPRSVRSFFLRLTRREPLRCESSVKRFCKRLARYDNINSIHTRP